MADGFSDPSCYTALTGEPSSYFIQHILYNNRKYKTDKLTPAISFISGGLCAGGGRGRRVKVWGFEVGIADGLRGMDVVGGRPGEGGGVRATRLAAMAQPTEW